MTSDRITKQVLLRAPRARVWRALGDSAEFGLWFGIRFDGPFVPGATLNGRVVPTAVDPQIAEQQKPYEGLVFPVYVEAVVPMERLAFRWHPYSIEPGGDYSNEPTTLVTFDLADAPGGVLLTIVESGFEQIPVARRAEAFKANETGWEEQTRLIAKYLDAHAHA